MYRKSIPDTLNWSNFRVYMLICSFSSIWLLWLSFKMWNLITSERAIRRDANRDEKLSAMARESLSTTSTALTISFWLIGEEVDEKNVSSVSLVLVSMLPSRSWWGSSLCSWEIWWLWSRVSEVASSFGSIVYVCSVAAFAGECANKSIKKIIKIHQIKN